MPLEPPVSVTRLARIDERQLDELGRLLVDCVAGGASVSFLHPLAPARAREFWSGVAAQVARGERALLVALEDGAIVGTVQLALAQPENQPHRADLAKMLVHPRARRRGIGAALLAQAHVLALACGKTLLVLDTASAGAARLYGRMGWQRCGTVPGYALLPQGGLCDTTFYYRQLP